MINGIYGNQIMHEEIFRDKNINNEERVKIILFRSKDKNMLGMISLRKGNILFFTYYRYYQKFEYNQRENEYLYTTQNLKDRWLSLCGGNRSIIESSEEILFSEHYRTFLNGLFNGEIYRNIYCGRLKNYKKIKWLKNFSKDNFRYRYEEENDLYFIIDTEDDLSKLINNCTANYTSSINS